MRLLVAFSALVLALVTGASAHAQQQGANAEPSDPAAKARLRMEGAAGGTGARVPPEASGGATAGAGSQHRHSAPEPPDTQQPPPREEKSSARDEKSSERKESQNTQRADAEPSDPAAKARLRMEGAAGGTGARIPEEASGGATAVPGHQHRN